MNNLAAQKGFTYIVLLVALIVMGIMADVLTRSTSVQKKRELEQELLFRGTAYYNAIKSYYLSSATRQYPKRVDDLLFDNRFAFKRHLRQAYLDPITGDNWKLLRNRKGCIVGVVSTSGDKPLKQENFNPIFQEFANADHYSDWAFTYNPDQHTAAKQK